MLSTSLHHQYAPTFTSLPSSAGVMSHAGHLQSHGLSTPEMDTLSNASGYSLHHLHQTGSAHHSLQSSKNTMKNRHHPYNNGNYTSANGAGRSATSEARNGTSTTSSGPVRRRISRACDQCNQLRTKCDGKLPCAHCVDFGLSCEYVRERKKRGKASRKDIQQQQAAAAAAAGIVQSPTGFSSEGPSPTASIHSMSGRQSLSDLPRQTMPGSRSMSLGSALMTGSDAMNQLSNPRTGSLGDLSTITVGTPVMNGHHHHHQLPAQNHHLSADSPHSHMSQHDGMDNGSDLGLNDYDRMQDFSQSAANGSQGLRLTEHLLQTRAGLQRMSGSVASSHTGSVYGDAPFAMLSPQSHHGHPNGYSSIPRTCDSPLTGFMGNSPTAGSPAWMSLPSPPTNYPQQYQSSNNLRYPVLRPLLSHIGSIMPISLACDLLDLYFTSSSSAHMHPLSPYILGYVFRKRSILHPTNPRPCSPALLASMLWVAAQTSDAPHLTVPPAARTRTCQKLLELTVSLLKPLIHVPSSGDGVNGQANHGGMMINGVSLGGLGVAMPVQINGSEGGAVGAAGALDDVVTYIHLASIVSASEYKAASLRWWHAAWSLARELKLNRELPPSPNGDSPNDADADGEADLDLETAGQQSPHGPRHAPNCQAGPTAGHSGIREEEREERRRIWWLLYIVDRHLALCYNRPLALLDIECDGLLLPIDETVWQFGDVFTGDTTIPGSSPTNTLPRHRRRGPSFECTGHSIFGYFLPLMTILGEIVDLNHARNHPRFGVGFRNSEEWDSHSSEISQQLEIYGRSLQEFGAKHLSNNVEDDAHSNQNNNEDVPPSRGKRMTEAEIQTRIVVAYGTHVMHVLHILLTGKWDPITLLDDNDLWISSQSFISSTGHAVSAAEAISDILEYDPDLSFMPFFFGIYLLQGSFLLLLIADKLQGEASPSVVKACETIVRAHEACVVTLNTEYQRNFRKVMRSALAQVRGRIPEDTGEQQLRRREVLALYRWTGDGTGLAL